jgi:conjugative transfer signal peptidase TraF
VKRATVLSAAGLALTALALAPITTHRPLVIWNASASAPIGLYRVDRRAEPIVGDRVLYQPSAQRSRWFASRGYLPANVPLLKPVAATAPSIVCRHGRTITIDRRIASLAQARDAAGRPLPHWQGCTRLGQDAVFLLARDIPDSLDSRYFGPVDRRELLGRALPVWVREARP